MLHGRRSTRHTAQATWCSCLRARESVALLPAARAHRVLSFWTDCFRPTRGCSCALAGQLMIAFRPVMHQLPVVGALQVRCFRLEVVKSS